MDLSNIRARQIATPLAIAVGMLGLGTGTLGVLNPLAFTGTIGIPITSSTSPAIPFAAFTAARNISGGITGLLLLYSGMPRAAGLCLMAGASTGMADAWICAKYGATEGKAMGHAIMALVIAAVGGVLFYGA